MDVDLPRDALVVFTGVSGSGKSSLAFGTIFAEAQRRYLESLAPHARRLIQQVAAPDVDDITGLPPAVALQQRAPGASARSSVGSLTTLSNTLRLLYSRAGTYPPGAPQLDSDAFSPNTHAGACPACHGIGAVHRTTEATMVPDPSLSIRERAIAAWPGAWHGKNLRDILGALGYDVDRPWSELPQADRDWILFTDDQPVVTVHPVRDATTVQGAYEGTYTSARRYVLHTIANTKSAGLRNRALQFVETVPCSECDGSRLRPEALAVTIAGRTIAELAALPLDELSTVLDTVANAPSALPAEVLKPLVDDLLSRISTLAALGLGHLGADRSTTTLSAGELQRLRLATVTRSGLFGVVYVLDEPSAGLHPSDTEAVLAVLNRLRGAGNTIFVVEHDMTVARRADWIVDVGPGAGTSGGRVLYSGQVPGLAHVAESVTRHHLFASARQAAPPPRTPHGLLALRGLRRNNLRALDVDVPLGVLTAITGVSGSGKTSLLTELAAAVRDGAAGAAARLVEIDQAPIGRTPRSNLATYTGLFDGVRRLFADTDAARELGYDAGRFSFNRPEGRCAACEGEGHVAIELLFLPTVYTRCEACGGGRYNAATLEVTYRGRSIAEVLALTVAEAAPLFADVPAVARRLMALLEVGLGYLRLGQPATELSGGEAQRLKLAAELRRVSRGKTVYILDEPTSGLHPADVQLLLDHLERLVSSGNTVVVAEHDVAVIAQADHVLDLGPGGGHRGGMLVAAGSPAAVASCPRSATAPYLAAALSSDRQRDGRSVR